MKAKKGEWGYFDAERKRKIAQSVILFCIPLLILITSRLYFGTQKNVMTVVAMVGIVPACMSLVSVIMFMFRKSLPEEEYRELSAHEGDLTVAYELYMTSEKRNALVDCLAVCGNEVVGYVSDPKTDLQFARDHLQKMLRADGFKVSVRMLGDRKHFIERLDGLNAHAEDLRKDIRYEAPAGYEGYGREDMIRHCALNISL